MPRVGVSGDKLSCREDGSSLKNKRIAPKGRTSTATAIRRRGHEAAPSVAAKHDDYAGESAPAPRQSIAKANQPLIILPPPALVQALSRGCANRSRGRRLIAVGSAYKQRCRDRRGTAQASA